MTITLNAARRLPAHLSICLIGCVILLTLFTASAGAQSATDGSTPSGLSPGAPAGAYALSDFESVNLYNGTLSFNLPLLKVAGRGGAGYSAAIRMEQKWLVSKFREEVGMPYVYMAEPNWWNEDGGILRPYSAGGMHVRQGHNEQFSLLCNGAYVYTKVLTRLTFTAPDGTEYDLRDQLSNGQPVQQTGCTPFNRGKVFVTADGTAATYVSDADITELYYDDTQDLDLFGYLSLRDGTRFRIDGGKISWMRDRNGNRVTYTYDGYGRIASVTDSLNRQVTITYAAGAVTYDQINFKGYGGAARTLKVGQTNLGNALRSDFTLQTSHQLFPNMSASYVAHNPPVFSYVELPDGRRYEFQYNSYGELARVVLPTGGAVEYDYAAGLADGESSGMFLIGTDKYIYRRVVERRMYPDGATGAAYASRTTYSRPETTAGANIGYVVSDTLSQAGALLGRSRHYFYGSPRASFGQEPTEYAGWKDGREYRTETFDTDGATVLRRVTHTFAQRAAVGWWAGAADGEPPNDPRVTQTVTTLSDTNQVSKQTYIYDQYNNRTDVYEYNYGAGAAGSLARRTHTGYVTTNVVAGTTYNYDSDTAIHLRSLPEQTSVYNAAGVEQARTAYEYDNYTATANHAALAARTGISGLDSAYTTAKKTRGNATATTRYLLTGGAVTGLISTYQQFDVAGNVVKAVDGRGYATTFGFADSFGSPDAEAQLNTGPVELGAQSSYAYTTVMTNAMGHKFYTQRDYHTGLVVDAEDPNGVTASAYYDDPLDRPTKVIRASDDTTQALTSQKTFSYDDAAHIITIRGDLADFQDGLLKSQTLYDGLGRTVETRRYETATAYVMSKRIYDALGRVNKVSNPYKTGQSLLWTTTVYDALGRVESVTTPDNAVVTTSYSGNTVAITDQAGKDRQGTTDALGRLTQVVEAPGASGYGYATNYTYDVFGNLKTVTQSGPQNGVTVTQTRTFAYDSLSRLSSAVSPESGTTTYAYDDNGNLTLKSQARSATNTITAAITYDAINRPTLKNYNNSTNDEQTPDVRYYYDTQTLPTGAPSFTRGASKGRLVAVTTGGTSAGAYYGYDGLGQVLRRIQRTDSVNYLSEATYNRAGSLLTETYPAVPGATDRRTVNYTYDGAGRLSALDSAATTYAAGASVSVTGITYAPHGSLDKETLGNGLVHDVNYNNRLQPTQIRLGTTAAPTSVLNLAYNYGTTANNGNILDVTEKIGAWTVKQVYTYDPLNRLDTTTETNGSTTTWWTEDNDYDRFGNRREVISGSTPLTFNSKNQVGAYDYDSAGNLTDDTAHTYDYDAENRVKAVDGEPNVHVYDGEGHRVKKNFAQGEQTRFVHGIRGQLLMEFAAANGAWEKEYIYGAGGLVATIEPVGGTKYTTSDHLGSPRVITTNTGAPFSRHDYKPFGQELGAGDGGRTATHLFGVDDNLRQKFTQYERDEETGLDYAQARYYARAQGRFTSPDPTLESGKLEVPQSWNRYSYVLNNPTFYTDPDGELWTHNTGKDSSQNPYMWVDTCGEGQRCWESVAYDYGAGVRIYGSNGAEDIQEFQANGNGQINIDLLSKHRDSKFVSVASTQRIPEAYLSTAAAATLFNVAIAYRALLPNDAQLVFANGNLATGKPCQGCHAGHEGGDIDLRYMGVNGQPLHGKNTYLQADVPRTNIIITLFAITGLPEVFTGDDSRFGVTDNTPGVRDDAEKKHHHHLHVGVFEPTKAVKPNRKK